MYFPLRAAFAVFAMHLAGLTEFHLDWLQRASRQICSVAGEVVDMH
ncbi:hypothetical protein HMPREF9622_01729 [Cutibacterium modestum HL037PA3]|nr:hypothetical protein HMPREF9622_01729 [Cutibacterium modestum HL037PA3]